MFNFSTQTDRFTVSVYTKGKKDCEVMFGCHLHKGYQLFYEKGAQIMQYVKTSQGNHIQTVTNISVKS